MRLLSPPIKRPKKTPFRQEVLPIVYPQSPMLQDQSAVRWCAFGQPAQLKALLVVGDQGSPLSLWPMGLFLVVSIGGD